METITQLTTSYIFVTVTLTHSTESQSGCPEGGLKCTETAGNMSKFYRHLERDA